MFDDIQEVEDVVITDKREAIEAIKTMQGGFNATYAISRNRSEREFITNMLKILDAFETTLKSFPPPGTYRKIS